MNVELLILARERQVSGTQPCRDKRETLILSFKESWNHSCRLTCEHALGIVKLLFFRKRYLKNHYGQRYNVHFVLQASGEDINFTMS